MQVRALKVDEPACTPGFPGRLYGLSGYPAAEAENVGTLRLVGVGNLGGRRRFVGLLRTICGLAADCTESGLVPPDRHRGEVATEYLGGSGRQLRFAAATLLSALPGIGLLLECPWRCGRLP